MHERGWTLGHPQYGKWFMPRQGVIDDWKQDHAKAYPEDAGAEPTDDDIATWFAEQITWIEVAQYGRQIERPDMAAFERDWLDSMKHDSNNAVEEGAIDSNGGLSHNRKDSMLTELTIDQQLALKAHALRPVRVVKGEAVYYTAITFPKNPRSGCEHTLRVAQVTGELGRVGGPVGDLWIDILDENGDILQEWPVGPKCFEHLRRKLRFVREAD